MDIRPYVVVVGGANIDIAGKPSGPLVQQDSNQGTVRLSLGGVGRNIAHNLALLGVDVHLVTVFGEDAHAEVLRAGCSAAGINTSLSFTIHGGSTSTYLYVADEKGEMQVAINDMAILEELTPERLSERIGLLNRAALCVFDTNLPTQAIRCLADEVRVPLFCDPISTAKAARISGVLDRIHTLKPNRLEAAALTGIDDDTERGAARASNELLRRGLKRAFVSLGADGLICGEKSRTVRLPLLPCHVVNTTGGGDALMAGLVWAYLQGLDLADSGLAGLAASAIAVESDQTVSPLMSEELLRARMGA